MQSMQKTSICEEDGGPGLVVKPICQNRLRSTTKCRRQCCRKKHVDVSSNKTVQTKLGRSTWYCRRGCCQQIPESPYFCILDGTSTRIQS
ncbi:MAG: hypothetical protein [Circular genetic element sp.]|nr:MAG: hypothetical protein [Circular genetic element sp.]